MKKIIKNRAFQICFVVILVVFLIMLCIINRYNEDIVTRATKVLWVKYYKVECINEKCKYVVAYKGNENGKSTIKIIDSNGKTVGKYKDNYSSKDKYRYRPVDATNSYIVLGKTLVGDDKSHGYKIISTNGKKIYETSNSISVITSNYFYEENNNLYTIFDYKGNALYKDVTELNFYNNKKIISFKNSDELTIIDKNSNRILNGYSIKEEIKEDNRTLYLIVESNDGGYYYFDVDNNEIVGDSFTNYVVLSNKKLMINKKENNEVKKYLYSKYGKLEKELSSRTKLFNEYSEKLGEDYSILDDSIVSANQRGLIVRNNKDHSFGTYEIETGKYEKLFDLKELVDAVYEDTVVTTYNLYEDEENMYLQIGCSLNYCDEQNILVYNPMTNIVSFREKTGKEIKKYRQYDGNYKVVMYTDKTYALINDKDEEILTSENNIVVLDQKVVIDDDISKSNVLLYSTKENKVINDNNTLAILDTTSNYNIYKYSTEDSLFLYKDNGDFIKEIPIASSSISISDKYILYSSNNKVHIIRLSDNREITYNLTTKETLEDKDGINVSPYKGLLVISDFKDKNIRVMNYNLKQIKKIKNSTVENVYFNEDNNSIFLITKQENNYGLYIIK